MAGAAAVEAEHELVEVELQVLAARTVVDAEPPSFEVGKYLLNPGQGHMGGHGADDTGAVVHGRHSARVAGQPSVLAATLAPMKPCRLAAEKS